MNVRRAQCVHAFRHEFQGIMSRPNPSHRGSRAQLRMHLQHFVAFFLAARKATLWALQHLLGHVEQLGLAHNTQELTRREPARPKLCLRVHRRLRKLSVETPGISSGYWKARKMPFAPALPLESQAKSSPLNRPAARHAYPSRPPRIEVVDLPGHSAP